MSIHLHAQGSNFVTYDDSAIKKKAEVVKEKIKLSKNYSYRIMASSAYIHEHNLKVMKSADALTLPSDLHLVKEREAFRSKNNSCHNGTLYGELTETFQKNCNYEEIRTNCLNGQQASKMKFEQVNARLREVALSQQVGMLQTLRGISANLSSVFNDLVKYNDSCSSITEKTLMSNQCFDTYNKVFDERLSQFLGDTCDEEIIDQMVDDFSIYMRKTVVGRLNEIITGHIKSRELEGKVAEKLVAINKTIRALENRLPADTHVGSAKEN